MHGHVGVGVPALAGGEKSRLKPGLQPRRDGNGRTVRERLPAHVRHRDRASALRRPGPGRLPLPGPLARLPRRPEGPSLLGGAQALLDGGRLVFERPGPDTALVRDLWLLLPTSTRCTLWPAGFAFGTALDFHALVVPPGGAAGRERFLNEDQA